VSQFAVCSVKGAPGATTLALAMSCALTHAHSQPAALVEADPAGGDLAARLGRATDPGMVSLAAASRHGSAWPDVSAHGQPLPRGGWVLLASTDPTQAAATVITLASRFGPALGEVARDAVFDCGRWTPASPATRLLLEVTAPTRLRHPPASPCSARSAPMRGAAPACSAQRRPGWSAPRWSARRGPSSSGSTPWPCPRRQPRRSRWPPRGHPEPAHELGT